MGNLLDNLPQHRGARNATALPQPIIFAIDPGTVKSGTVTWDGCKILRFSITENTELLRQIIAKELTFDLCAIENPEGRGQFSGGETFKTCFWVGRFYQAVIDTNPDALIPYLIGRKRIVTHLCGSARAGDSQVTEVLRLKFGHTGDSRKPGPLHEITSHALQALAVAMVVSERIRCGLKEGE